MRTTLTIDDDVLATARQIASTKGISVGAAISELVRSSISTRSGKQTTRSGILLLPVNKGAQGATLEEVNRLRDEVS